MNGQGEVLQEENAHNNGPEVRWSVRSPTWLNDRMRGVDGKSQGWRFRHRTGQEGLCV